MHTVRDMYRLVEGKKQGDDDFDSLEVLYFSSSEREFGDTDVEDVRVRDSGDIDDIDDEDEQESLENEDKWYTKLGKYLKEKYEAVQGFFSHYGERIFGDPRGLTGNIGAGLFGAVGAGLYGVPGLIGGLVVGSFLGAYVGNYLRKQSEITEFDIIIDEMEKNNHENVAGELKKIYTSFKDEKKGWEDRISAIKDNMLSLYSTLDIELGNIEQQDAKLLVLKVDSALNYLEALYIEEKKDNPDIRRIERELGYSFEEDAENFKNLYKDVDEHPPSDIIDLISGIKEQGYISVAVTLNELSASIYTGRYGKSYHRWFERLSYMRDNMQTLRKEMDVIFAEKPKDEARKVYLDVSSALNIMTKTYIDKRNYLYAIRVAEKYLQYNFSEDTAAFVKEYADAHGDDEKQPTYDSLREISVSGSMPQYVVAGFV